MFAAATLVGQDLRRNLLAGARLAFFFPVRALDFRVSVAQYAALVLTSLAFWLAGGMLRQGFPGHLDSAAFAVALAQIPPVLAACFLAAKLFREPQLALAFAVLLVATDPVFEAVGVAVQLASDFDAFAPYAEAANWIFLAWSFAVLVRAQLVLTGWRGRRSVAALVLFAVLLAGLIAYFPRTELWAPDEADAEAGPSLLQEEIFHRQGMLLDEQLAALQPERPGIADLYFLGVAADGGQDTFYKELMSVRQLLEDRFDVAGRSIVLVNNPATLRELPIASVSNLRAALDGLGRKIDAERDVVLLHIATHGSSDHRLYFNMPPLELDQLTPTALARMLTDSGIKWKVIVISACYAGGYIEPLKDDNTLIITASDATHTSFGCSADSDFTWFSEAYYDDALRETRSFTEAFEMAKETVAEREQSEGYAPSNPQMFLGRAMRAKLAELDRRLDRGPAPDSKLRNSPIRPEKK
jgi:Peptidase C13 family